MVTHAKIALKCFYCGKMGRTKECRSGFLASKESQPSVDQDSTKADSPNNESTMDIENPGSDVIL